MIWRMRLGHRTRMQRMPLNAGGDFAVREVPPALRLTKPFPSVLTIQRSVSATRRDLLRSIRHQIIVASQDALDVECRAGGRVGVSSARGQHT
jgi:hypothetical protein